VLTHVYKFFSLIKCKIEKFNYCSTDGEESERDKILLEDFCSVDSSPPGLTAPIARLKMPEQSAKQQLSPRWIHIKEFLVRVCVLVQKKDNPITCAILLNYSQLSPVTSCSWRVPGWESPETAPIFLTLPSRTKDSAAHSTKCLENYFLEIREPQNIFFFTLNLFFIFIFRRDLSDLNVTFPFPAVDWTPEEGYPRNYHQQSLPWKTLGAGRHLGLTVVLDCEQHEYFCSSTASVGFKVWSSIYENYSLW